MKALSKTAMALLAGTAFGAVAVQSLHAQSKSPAYVVTETNISDLDRYEKEYVQIVQATIKTSGGRVLAASKNIIALDGPPPGVRAAINEFDSLDAVRAWRATAAYKDARAIGDKYAKFRSFAVEGIAR